MFNLNFCDLNLNDYSNEIRDQNIFYLQFSGSELARVLQLIQGWIFLCLVASEKFLMKGLGKILSLILNIKIRRELVQLKLITMRKIAENVGIVGAEIYFPRSFVSQAKLEQFDQVSKGKYTIGLGQHSLAFTHEFEDVNSLALTAVDRLLKAYKINPEKVGRLEVGTETLTDKSKSTKTVLMSLFKGSHDIEGATSLNACYGATNALFNSINWMKSQAWDGRLAIVVAVDIAVYQKGPARPTGGAGAVALLIGPDAPIVIDGLRSTYMDHQYDFYKPKPNSEYPTVDGTGSIQLYLNALEQCYMTLKTKYQRQGRQFPYFDYHCFHSPFHKMVQKAFIQLCKIDKSTSKPQEIANLFKSKVQPSMLLSKTLGNIYTGSLYSGLISLIETSNLENKSIMMFSYGSGLMASMFTLHVRGDISHMKSILNIKERLEARIEIDPTQFDTILAGKERNYGKFLGKLQIKRQFLTDGVFYLSEIDEKGRRFYNQNFTGLNLKAQGISAINQVSKRLKNLDMQITQNDDFKGFYKMSMEDRLQTLNKNMVDNLNTQILSTGGLSLEKADAMIENVIGMVGLPLAIAPNFVINNKKYQIPMCIQEPSVVAACSSIGKLISPYSFFSSSTQNIMIGQVHVPDCEIHNIHNLITVKQHVIKSINSYCQSLVQRGGGVQDLRTRQLGPKQHVVEILVNVCEAMGANIVNTLCEKLKNQLSSMGFATGIAVLSNYCPERMASSWFEIPIQDLAWKGANGYEVAKKVLQAYDFAKLDKFRAATHNKGVMNGIDSVCVATGQDWRAVETSIHVHASQTGKYSPLTHYQIIEKNGKLFFKGIIQIPVAIGTVGGAASKNPIYQQTRKILGDPNTKEFSEILATVGLAQNFGALRALAIEGIQKGHMKLHARGIAVKAGVPLQLIEEACKYMVSIGKFDEATAKAFLLTCKPQSKL